MTQPTLEVASDNEQLFLFNGLSQVSSLDLKNLNSIWISDLAGEIKSNIALSGNYLYLVTSLKPKVVENVLWVIDKRNGLIKKKIYLSSVSFSGGSDNLYIFPQDKDLIIYGKYGLFQKFSLEMASDDIKQVLDVNLNSAFLNVQKKSIFFSSDNKINKFDSIDNKLSTVYENKSVITSFSISEENSLLIGDDRGWITTFDLVSSKVNWRFQAGGRINKMLILKTGMLVFSKDDFIYNFSQSKGNLIWKKRFNDLTDAQSFILGTNLLLKLNGEPNLKIIKIKDGKIVNQLGGLLFKDQKNVQVRLINTNEVLLSNLETLALLTDKSCR